MCHVVDQTAVIKIKKKHRDIITVADGSALNKIVLFFGVTGMHMFISLDAIFLHAWSYICYYACSFLKTCLAAVK